MRFSPIALALLSSLAVVAAIPSVTRADILKELRDQEEKADKSNSHVSIGRLDVTLSDPLAEFYYDSWVKVNSKQAERQRRTASWLKDRKDPLAEIYSKAADASQARANYNEAKLKTARQMKGQAGKAKA